MAMAVTGAPAGDVQCEHSTSQNASYTQVVQRRRRIQVFEPCSRGPLPFLDVSIYVDSATH